MDAAGLGGMAHLVNFKGTDTVPALIYARQYYKAAMAGFSVPATEHSIMTSLGRNGEDVVVEKLLKEYPTGILSVVADSYNIYNFVEKIVAKDFLDKILARDGVFVIRPDSVNDRHRTPEDQIVWILNYLYDNVEGSKINTKGYKEINPKIKVLWGDGLDYLAIKSILNVLKLHGFSVSNIATFGMGAGLLQKVNRDTQRFAFKCSAMKRSGEWFDIVKDPIGSNKTSKSGLLTLIKNEEGFKTIRAAGSEIADSVMELRFLNGRSTNNPTFEQVRNNAKL
jgi:nicotinamide phosphoribosyltransferase